jgi:hypothetical protein
MRGERRPASVPATTSIGVRRVNKIASVPPYLLRSAFGHDGLWVFANRIFANWIFSNRILAHRRRHWRGWLLARQVGGASSAQHDNPTVMLNTAMNPAVLNTAKNAVVTTLMSFFTLIPLVCRSPRTSDRGTPLFAPSGRAVSTAAYF